MNKPLILHHIHKTAGTSLIHYFESIFPPEKRLVRLGGGEEENKAHEMIASNSVALEEIQVVFGHHAYQLKKYFETFYQGGFFRHPTKRLLSTYMFHKKVIDEGLVEGDPVLGLEDGTLIEFLDALIKFANWIGGLYAGGVENPNMMAIVLHEYVNNEKKVPNFEDNEANLGKLDYVGLQEHVDLSLFLLKEQFNFPLETIENLNESGQGRGLSYFPKWFEDEIEGLLDLDFDVYRRACSIFDKNVNDFVFNSDQYFEYQNYMKRNDS